MGLCCIRVRQLEVICRWSHCIVQGLQDTVASLNAANFSCLSETENLGSLNA